MQRTSLFFWGLFSRPSASVCSRCLSSSVYHSPSFNFQDEAWGKKRSFSTSLSRWKRDGKTHLDYQQQLKQKADRVDLPNYQPFDPRGNKVDRKQNEWLEEFSRVIKKAQDERERESKNKKEENGIEWEKKQKREERMKERQNEKEDIEKMKGEKELEREKKEKSERIEIRQRRLEKELSLDSQQGVIDEAEEDDGNDENEIMDDLAIENLKEGVRNVPHELDEGLQEEVPIRPHADFIFFDLFSGMEINLSSLKGTVLLVVNISSSSALSGQLFELEMLHLKYQKRGLNILAIPCSDFGSSLTDAQVREDYKEKRFSFLITKKVHLRKGPEQHALFSWIGEFFPELLPEHDFEKILIGRDGSLRTIAPFFLSPAEPDFLEMIEELLNEKVDKEGKIVDEGLVNYQEEIQEILKDPLKGWETSKPQ